MFIPLNCGAVDLIDNESWDRLAEAGFNIEQFDVVKKLNSRPLSGQDEKPMRELQDIVRRWKENQLGRIKPLGLLDLLIDTSSSVGRRVQMLGRVRQCLRIKNDVEAVGQNGLFQLTLFPDLDGQTINVKTPSGERVTYGRFAVIVRASALPPDETAQSLLNKRVRVDGIHYRFWWYESEFANQNKQDGQIGALVIAGPVQVLANPPDAMINNGLMGLFGLVSATVLLIGFWCWKANQEIDRSYDALPDLLPDDWKAE